MTLARAEHRAQSITDCCTPEVMMLCTWANGLDGFQATVRMPSRSRIILRERHPDRSSISNQATTEEPQDRDSPIMVNLGHSMILWSATNGRAPRRTVTETDVVLFAGLSGDFNPLHVDHSSSQKRPVRPAGGPWTAGHVDCHRT